MDTLLTILSDGEFHSGEDLGARLGVSRTAVWKQVQKLVETGLPLETQKGCGYRIPGGLELLNQPELERLLTGVTQSVKPELHLFNSITSTNALAREAAESQNATGMVFLAEQQTEGRGRRGREWFSPLGRNIYLSVAWGFDGVQFLEGLSLSVGVAVRRALESCGIREVAFKWPNDLIFQGKKLGGILLEVIGDPAGFCQVIIGIGINLNMPATAEESIDQPWADVSEAANEPVSRNRLAAAIVAELFELLSGYQDCGFAAYRSEWLRYDAFSNREVKLHLMNKVVQGVSRGVDERGALLIECDGAVQAFSGGEISLRAGS